METAKTTFDLLVDCLGKNKEIHLHIIWGTLALQIAAIGWFLSSGSARSLIAAHRDVRIIGVVIVTLIAVIHFGLLIGTCRESDVLYARITENAYYKSMPDELSAIVDFWRIGKWKAVMRGVFTLSLFGSLNYLIYSCSSLVVSGDVA